MTTFKAVNKTLIDTGGLVSQLAAGLQDGRVKCSTDVYEADGTEIAASVIEMGGDLPAGAKVLAIIVAADTTESSLTISVGDTQNATRYTSANANLDTAGDVLTLHGKNYVIGTVALDSQIILTTAGATLTSGSKYFSTTYYTTD